MPHPSTEFLVGPALALARATEHLHDGLVVADATRSDLPIVSVNPAFERMTGYAATDVVGRSCRFLQGRDTDQPGVASIRSALAAEQALDVVLRNYTRSGRLFFNHLRLAPVRADDGTLTQYIGIQRDVTEETHLRRKLQSRNRRLRATVRRLKSLCLTDPLTGLANRRAFAARLEGAWAAAERERTPVSLLMVDVDWFKAYNDHHGHPAGDATLRRVAGVIRGCARRRVDVAARHGGEEFALLAPGMDARCAAATARKLVRRVRRARLLHGASPLGRVTVSVGHATAFPGGERRFCLVRSADAALYEAKAGGRDRFHGGGRPAPALVA